MKMYWFKKLLFWVSLIYFWWILVLKRWCGLNIMFIFLGGRWGDMECGRKRMGGEGTRGGRLEKGRSGGEGRGREGEV